MFCFLSRTNTTSAWIGASPVAQEQFPRASDIEADIKKQEESAVKAMRKLQHHAENEWVDVTNVSRSANF